MIFTFWEGKMPAYIKLCLDTWKFDYTVLNYDNLNDYTNIDISAIQRFTLPQIADIVRVHVLRDNGGYWLDADTIMISGKLPTENMIGYPELRANTIGYLHANKPHEQMFDEWANYQDIIIDNPVIKPTWDIVGNAFTDDYVKAHSEISIADVTNCWAETYMVKELDSRYDKYRKFYFTDSYDLSDLQPTDMLMLHNSWTPNWYKNLFEDKLLDLDCTMSNILREVLR